MRSLLVALALVLATPSLAQMTFPANVPPECAELAVQNGVPLVLSNKFQAAKADHKLNRLRNNVPGVKECRDAVDALKALMKEKHP